jgi:hypothetical protein
VVAIGPRALDYAVDELLGVDGSRTTKVASGEHLAAILLTALVGPPGPPPNRTRGLRAPVQTAEGRIEALSVLGPPLDSAE